jgi:UDP-2,3-diacylglucosamine pyrophosphatase LpxH
MKLDVVSDLHVDIWFGTTQLHNPDKRMWEGEPHKSRFLHVDWRYVQNEGSDILVIAGDTANNVDTTFDVVGAAAADYSYVLVVDGNHEHYNGDGTVDENMERFRGLCSQYPNVTYLDGTTTFRMGNVLFVGATGWYDWKAYEDQFISRETAMQAWYQFSNDSRVPSYGKLGNPEQIAMVQAVQLAEQVRAAQDDDTIEHIVVTTHMSPRADLMEWKTNLTWNQLTPSYVNTALKQVLDADAKRKISTWIYGHTHYRKMSVIDGITYINNARGYPRENPSFEVIQVEI